MNSGFLGPAIATVLTACGIETHFEHGSYHEIHHQIATVLTACGIETPSSCWLFPYLYRTLQQYLPLAVLKL